MAEENPLMRGDIGISEKGCFVEDILKGRMESGRGIFYVESKREGERREGGRFLKVTLSDRTGRIEGRIWEKGEEMDGLFSENDFAEVEFRRDVYRDEVQVKILDIKRVDGVPWEWFLKSSGRSPHELRDEILELVSKVENVHLRSLLEEIFVKDGDFMDTFLSAPASKTIHHGYIGGLAEHTITVAKLVFDISRYYPEVDRDLLVTAALLHDIGKVWEIESLGPKNEYTDCGMLLGHIYLGASMVERYMEEMENFPEHLKYMLLHAILSHHGELGFGSPVEPKTPEALLLHYADNLDAKLTNLLELGRDADTSWVYNKVLKRKVFFHGIPGGEDKENS